MSQLRRLEEISNLGELGDGARRALFDLLDPRHTLCSAGHHRECEILPTASSYRLPGATQLTQKEALALVSCIDYLLEVTGRGINSIKLNTWTDIRPCGSAVLERALSQWKGRATGISSLVISTNNLSDAGFLPDCTLDVLAHVATWSTHLPKSISFVNVDFNGPTASEKTKCLERIFHYKRDFDSIKIINCILSPAVYQLLSKIVSSIQDNLDSLHLYIPKGEDATSHVLHFLRAIGSRRGIRHLTIENVAVSSGVSTALFELANQSLMKLERLDIDDKVDHSPAIRRTSQIYPLLLRNQLYNRCRVFFGVDRTSSKKRNRQDPAKSGVDCSTLSITPIAVRAAFAFARSTTDDGTPHALVWGTTVFSFVKAVVINSN